MAQKNKWVKSLLHSQIGAWIMAAILISCVKLIWMTCHVRHIRPPALLRHQTPAEPMIITHWHEFIPFILMLSPPRISVLNSSHADARILGYASRFVGARPIWGSSNRNPLSSLRQLSNETKKGRHVLITPDGPRGPARKMAPGPVALAQLTGRPIIFFAAHADKKWRLRSWDKTQIPKPFSKVTIYWSEPVIIDRDKDKTAQETALRKLEANLITFSEAADRGDNA
ncbi:MAG: lysophospholipid acyltransferase family protein [Candidatus Puniceispirillaceae bacterium]